MHDNNGLVQDYLLPAETVQHKIDSLMTWHPYEFYLAAINDMGQGAYAKCE